MSRLDLCARPDLDRPLVWPGYVHPWPLLATTALVVNDHLLKGAGLLPGWLTGKLSDLAGLFFFPLLTCAMLDLTLRAAGHRTGARPRHLRALCILTALGFAAVQLVTPAADLYRELGDAAAALLAGVHGVRSTVTMDATDLVALPMTWIAWRHGRRFFSPVP